MTAPIDIKPAFADRVRGPGAGLFQIAALARLAPRAALDVARTGIQMHGAIGFSAEADAHLFVRQAHILGQLAGTHDIMAHEAPMTPHR